MDRIDGLEAVIRSDGCDTLQRNIHVSSENTAMATGVRTMVWGRATAVSVENDGAETFGVFILSLIKCKKKWMLLIAVYNHVNNGWSHVRRDPHRICTNALPIQSTGYLYRSTTPIPY